jgi:uncharacterized protein (DUF488 family)
MTSVDELFTIGFTQKSAETFFGLLRMNNVRKLVDTRLNNTGQLAGFSKKGDLSYFAKAILGVEYVHWLESAPEQPALDAYKKKEITWDEYAREYEALLQRRRVESQIDIVLGSAACLLCSEAKPHRCHRRLLADYVNRARGGGVSVKHLV